MNLSRENISIFLFKYKQSGHVGLFDKSETSEKLSKLGNPCQRKKKEENERIKSGEGAQLWNEQHKKKRQKEQEIHADSG